MNAIWFVIFNQAGASDAPLTTGEMALLVFIIALFLLVIRNDFK